MLTVISALLLLSVIFAPLGCIVLWKRYIYFGDGLAHASLLAGTISIVADSLPIYSGIVVAVIFAFLVFKLKDVSGSNATISLIASMMLSISLIIASFSSTYVNIDRLLFGDIIAVTNYDIIILVTIFIIVAGFIKIFLNQITLIVLNRDIAIIRNVNVAFIELTFLILLSITVFSAIKIVGTLLVTSILIIPAMSARLVAKNPVPMIIAAVIISLITNIIAITSSFYLDLSLAPITILLATVIFTALLLRNSLAARKIVI